ncbi:MAG: hypothetical protein EPN82_01570 [Bacteroidetes bacterium]|nr:MAG: hypothetical protein EPN82_01570 [Bacteroidota bacterium]
MKVKIFICALLFIITSLFPVGGTAQDKRLVVISPSVGEDIDSTEAAKYGLFQSIENFYSCSFYRAEDNSLWVTVKLKSTEDTLRDSTFAISPELVNQYVGWINHWDEMRGTDALPLSPNTTGLSRPMFETICFDVSVGLIFNDLSELNQLTRSKSNSNIALSFYIQVPLFENPSIMFIGGWGSTFEGESSVSSHTYFFLYMPYGFNYRGPFAGLGVGNTSYHFTNVTGGYLYSNGGIDISVSETYPVLILGFNIFPHYLGLLFTYPIVNEMNTKFEGSSYTIKPAGPVLSMLLSF